MAPKKRLGEMLVDAGVIDEPKLKAALAHQRQWGVRLGQALVDLKLATEADVVRALSVKYGFGIAALDALDPGALERALALVPRDFAVQHNVFPMAADDETITVAISDPTHLGVVDELRFRTGRRVGICLGGDRELAGALKRHYPAAEAPEAEAAEDVALDLDISEHEMDAMFDPLGAAAGVPAATSVGSASTAQAIAQRPLAVGAPAAGPRPATSSAPVAGWVPPPEAPFPHAPVSGAGPGPAAAPAPAVGRIPPAEPFARQALVPSSPGAPTAGPRPAAPLGAAPQAVAPAPVRPGRPAGIPAPGMAPGRPPGAPGAPRPPAPGPAAVAGPRPPAPPAPRPAPPPAAIVAAPPSPAAGPAPDVAAAPAAAAPERAAIAAPVAAPASVAPAPAPPPLTPREAAILAALERLAGGAHAEPELLKPAQAMAALARVLLRKGIVTERELLDELVRRPPGR